MVAEGKLGNPARTDRVVERAAAHLRAQRAGVFFLPHVEDDLLDVGPDPGVGDVPLGAERGHGREVHALEAELDRDRLEREGQGVEAAQMVEREEQQQAVLAAGDADRNGVARLDHVIVVHRASHGPGEVVE